VSTTAVKSFLTDIAGVLNHSKLAVKVEVYSAPGGDVNMNLGITERRAKAMTQVLVWALKVPENQVQVVGMGMWDSSRSNIDRSILSKVTTRGAIFVVRRRN
jgi:outer membrane protein OmpA-like peptidoglycan-associated protein